MSLHTIIHDPTWQKVYSAAAVGTAGIAGIILLRMRSVRARKRDMYRPSVMAAETYGLDESEEISGTSHASLRGTSRTRGFVTALLALTCVTVTTCGYAFALRNYTILNNWAEGDRHTYVRDFVGAIVCYKKALRVDPTLRPTHLRIGEALIQSGRVRNAISELRVACQGERTNAEPYTALGDAYMILKRPLDALSAYTSASKISPRDAAVYIALATANLRLHRLDDAYADYEQAITLDPHDVKAYVKLGDMLTKYGHMDEGMAYCERAVDLAPNDIIALNALATAYAREGKYDSAIDQYKRSIELNPLQPLSYYDMGAAFERKNDKRHALDAFRSSAKIKPKTKMDADAIQNAEREIARLSP